MMFWSSADWGSSSDNLFDIALNLQTNKRIIADFWQLYFWDKWNEELRTSKKTSIGNFHTTNWVRVMWTAIWWSLRWKQFDSQRVDYIVFDDIETNVTIRSANTTARTIRYIDEAITALAPNSKVIVLWNRISDTWVVAYLEDKFSNDKKKSRVIEKAAIEWWKSTWLERFVLMDRDLNPKDKEQYSLETIKRQVNTNWRKVFEQEYLNQPMVDWDRLFDVERIDILIAELKSKPVKVVWNWKIWKWLEKQRWRWVCHYLMWIDISQWYWLDHSVIEVWNIDSWEQVAEYCNNLAPPEILVQQILWAHHAYNEAFIVPENNSIWASVISLLKDKGYWQHMPVQTTIDKVKNIKIQKFGWNTNWTTKPKMIFDLLKDFNEWNIIINSIPLLKEMRAFTNNDVTDTSFDNTLWADINGSEQVSSHFDRLIATAIMNQHKIMWSWFYVPKHNKIANSSASPDSQDWWWVSKTELDAIYSSIR